MFFNASSFYRSKIIWNEKKHFLKICFNKIKPVNTKCTIIFLTKFISTCLFTIGPICIDFVKPIKKGLYLCIINTHTIRKSLKMDGAKYIPTFAFRMVCTKLSKQEGKSYLNANKIIHIWENIYIPLRNV